jgi:diguanylate cyclase (GGDEF)-like protein
VLATLAEVLKSVLRAEDLVARWGGEEFLVLLPQVDLEGAAAAAERMRTAVLETPFQLPQGSLRVTVSLGVTAVPAGGRPRSELLASADAALYRAKAQGRNCVVVEAETMAEKYPMLVRVLETESPRLIACSA